MTEACYVCFRTQKPDKENKTMLLSGVAGRGEWEKTLAWTEMNFNSSQWPNVP